MSDASAYVLATLARNWWTFVLRGVVAIAFGIIAWAWPDLALYSLILMFAAYAIGGGILSIIAAVRLLTMSERWAPLLLDGAIGIGAGVVVLAWPDLAAKTFLYIIAIWAILTGAIEIFAAIRLRKEITNEWLLGLTGLAGIAFGVIAIARPESGALAVLWLIGLASILVGGLLVILGMRLRGLSMNSFVAPQRRKKGAAGAGAAASSSEQQPAATTDDGAIAVGYDADRLDDSDPASETWSGDDDDEIMVETEVVEIDIEEEAPRLTRRERALAELLETLPPEGEGWTRGDGATEAPAGYPLKGNVSSRIYHAPGGQIYGETVAEVYFADHESAAAAGFRPRQEPPGYGTSADSAADDDMSSMAGESGDDSVDAIDPMDVALDPVGVDSDGTLEVLEDPDGFEIVDESFDSMEESGSVASSFAESDMGASDDPYLDPTSESGSESVETEEPGDVAFGASTADTLDESSHEGTATDGEPGSLWTESTSDSGDEEAEYVSIEDEIEAAFDAELEEAIEDDSSLSSSGGSSTDDAGDERDRLGISASAAGNDSSEQGDRASQASVGDAGAVTISDDSGSDFVPADFVPDTALDDESSLDDVTGESEADEGVLIQSAEEGATISSSGSDATQSETWFETGESPDPSSSGRASDAELSTSASAAQFDGALAELVGELPPEGEGWVRGAGSYATPRGYPVKGNASSRLYHMPGGRNYAATIPEICFDTPEHAQAGGFRPRSGDPTEIDWNLVEEVDVASEAFGLTAVDVPESGVEIKTSDGPALDPAVASLMESLAPEGQGWLRGLGGYETPKGFPVKGNASSKLYHMPGGRNYAATIPEICFATPDDAVAGGFRPRSGDPTELDWNLVEEIDIPESLGIRVAPEPDVDKDPALAALIASMPPEGSGWVRGAGSHDCPSGYPVKGNGSSRIFHVETGGSYDVTIPEFCFASPEDAEAAGFRAAKN